MCGEIWKITLPCTRAQAEELAADGLFLSSSDSSPTLVTRHVDGAPDDDWLIEVYADAAPDATMLGAIAELAPDGNAKPQVEQVAEQDWVTLSQQGLEPLRAGRFHVHTSHDAPSENPRLRNLCIDASRAFGTGHHETTLGCLKTLDRLKSEGKRFRNIADIGTGTGLLAFAAQHLWPTARIVASDIDPVSIEVTRANALLNQAPLGNGPGRIALAVSNGLDHRAVRRRAPFDLIIANILAGPLIALAPQFAAASARGTVLILAGLIRDQREAIEAAYGRAGFRLSSANVENEWPCLTLRKTGSGSSRARIGASRTGSTSFGEW